MTGLGKKAMSTLLAKNKFGTQVSSQWRKTNKKRARQSSTSKVKKKKQEDMNTTMLGVLDTMYKEKDTHTQKKKTKIKLCVLT